MKDFRSMFVSLSLFAVIMSGAAFAAGEKTGAGDFSFVQISDTHWGFNNPAINPDWAGTLKKVIAEVNSLDPQPDFVVFTGDLTHTTDDPKERRKRLSEFRQIADGLSVKDRKFLPGEHDAGLDQAQAYREILGDTRYAFEHKGVHFIVLDNVSDPTSSVGEEQLKWLSDQLSKLDSSSRIVVFTHRPLFDLYPKWDWWTRDGSKVMELLEPYKNASVFYGHIHQYNLYTDGGVVNYSAKGTMYPLPAPGSVEKKAPVPWDAKHPYQGLGFRLVSVRANNPELVLTEYPIAADPIRITAKRFEYSPNVIRIKKGEPTILEFVSLDRLHGFNCPDLGVRTDITPGKTTMLTITAEKAGTYDFFCDIFCGDGHANMKGKIIAE